MGIIYNLWFETYTLKDFLRLQIKIVRVCFYHSQTFICSTDFPSSFLVHCFLFTYFLLSSHYSPTTTLEMICYFSPILWLKKLLQECQEMWTMILFLEYLVILTVDMESNGKKKVVMGWRGSAGTLIVGNIKTHPKNQIFRLCLLFMW